MEAIYIGEGELELTGASVTSGVTRARRSTRGGDDAVDTR